ncbi:MAG: hypothetical protein HYV16_06970 [Gammaproteobacteria bacterium]|nr:hypothetical protein [Gammaproteobacteria bacterium]
MRSLILRLSALTALLLFTNASAQYDGAAEECENAKEQAGSAASDLANYARRLQICAESEDFFDDCSTEFHRVKNAQGDYEMAVLAVMAYCN